jgi:hypothetical protein
MVSKFVALTSGMTKIFDAKLKWMAVAGTSTGPKGWHWRQLEHAKSVFIHLSLECIGARLQYGIGPIQITPKGPNSFSLLLNHV